MPLALMELAPPRPITPATCPLGVAYDDTGFEGAGLTYLPSLLVVPTAGVIISSS